jgi:release factor glutamine methyltransferase
MSKLKVDPPPQYQKGWTEFYKLKFKLTRDVLIPRPETELLVDEVLKLGPKTVVDVGTGSGNIAISIAKNIKDAKILALDISQKALEVAKENAKLNKVEKQIFFLESDLIEGLQKAPQVIVANLPYIPTARLKYIDPMVTEYEPRIGLDGGADGFELYKKLFLQMVQKNIYPKVLLAEIDYSHAHTAVQYATKYFPKCSVDIKKDLAKKVRILTIEF